MATADAPDKTDSIAEHVRDEWLNRLRELISQIERWAQDDDWSSRWIEKRLEDSQIGKYRAPELLLQKDTARLLLEPIGRTAPGADGVVDLYLMPAYDDIASLYFCDGRWNLHYIFPASPTVATIQQAEPVVLSQETFRQVLEEMMKNAV
jgi:hypothetical protein